ncbi:MAG TPA: glycoside hydrolase family 2 TIM barrel-domain containing protein [Planctomycetota bacterium]|nr:glycoside hydrolase family 2 TIM barrel-domain containing protein [Planctomycetota bacterium]
MAKRIPRNEYPRPEMVRKGWTNLNGKWRFEFDHGLTGLEEKWHEEHDYTRTITVPFCPESRLSGIGDRDFHASVWYEREIDVPKLKGNRMLLHFGACDYETTVFLNGEPLGAHRGGYTPFTFDLTEFAKPGKNRLTVFARDDLRSFEQPAGKQSFRRESFGCYYTRTTGIWQTVWVEEVPHVWIDRVVATPSEDLQRVRVDVDLAGSAQGELMVLAYAMDGNEVVASGLAPHVGGTRATVTFDCFKNWDVKRWSPDDPFLYTLRVRLLEKHKQVDCVTSYFGMRTVKVSGREFLVNDEPVYLKLVLDQGFYPDGVYTASTDAALKRDITLSLAVGYNGARLHQKVFEPRFLYWADRMGYLCWGEAPDWGARLDRPAARDNLMREWTEIVRRDVMHPSIVAWTATNEQHPESPRRPAKGEYLAALQRLIKQLDPSRPVIDNSGYWHTSTDVIDIHDYTQGDAIRKNWKKFGRTNRTSDVPQPHQPVMWPGWPVPSAPVVLSEVGGIGFVTRGAKGWGYGGVPRTKTAFMKRFRDTMNAIMEIPNACGFCYTQLTDVEQEINGIYTFDRKPKFDVKAIRRIHGRR